MQRVRRLPSGWTVNAGSRARARDLAAPHVAVLLCTYNGSGYLHDQLRSLAEQTHTNWSLVASDDGSSDDTVEQLQIFLAEHGEGRVELRDGPRKRGLGGEPSLKPREIAAANFLSVATDTRIDGDYFAFCDQDDIWSPDKLERAVAWLSAIPEHVPALYCSRTFLFSDGCEPFGLSPLFAKPPSFRNALVQSIAGGNTMVFNRLARDLLAKAGNTRVVAHDWWTYLLISGSGGLVHYDPVPSVKYRQHEGNIVGNNRGAHAVLERMHKVTKGDWSRWIELNLTALQRAHHLLTPENRSLVESFQLRRAGSMFARMGAITRLGLYRQTHIGQLSLCLAAMAARL